MFGRRVIIRFKGIHTKMTALTFTILSHVSAYDSDAVYAGAVQAEYAGNVTYTPQNSNKGVGTARKRPQSTSCQNTKELVHR